MPETSGAGWTDARVDQLKEMWSEGRSCSQIAAALGDGATRNAVIGKIHRLKLDKTPRIRVRQKRPGRKPAALELRDRRVGASIQASGSKASAAPPRPASVPPTLPRPEFQEFSVIVDDDIVGIPLVALTEHTCKWPIGDPLLPGFRFCGAGPVEGKPYCGVHYRRAGGVAQ